MQLKVLGSSSKGNSYILESEKETLILECGVHFPVIKYELNFDITNVVGCLVSHAHKDHSKSAKEIMTAGIELYTTPDTAKSFNSTNHRLHPVEPQKLFKVGSFKVFPFPLKHDVECFGYLIEHTEMGKLMFVTDTYFIPYKFVGLNQVLVECNYDIDIANKAIENGAPKIVRDRVLESHMEISTVIKFLQANDLTTVHNIILLHLSDGNSNAIDFKKRVEEVAPGKAVTVADRNMSINISKTPF